MNLSIAGKTAVINGSNSAIGLETAKLLATEGVNIVLSDLKLDTLEKAAEEVRKHCTGSSKVITVTAD